MRRKKYLLLMLIILLLIFFEITGCYYFNELNYRFSNLFRLKINLFNKVINFIKFKLNRLVIRIDRFFSSYLFIAKNANSINNRDYKVQKINQLKEFGKKYDELILNKMLLYSSSGIPLNDNIIISLYFYSGQKKIEISKYEKYHFKLIEISKDGYNKIINQKLLEIEKVNSPLNNKISQKKDSKKLLFLRQYKLILKNSKPAILSLLQDEEGNQYYAILENLEKEFYSLPSDFNFYYKNQPPKIKFHTFYYYPLSSSLMELVIGFTLPIEPVKIYLFFAIIFIIVIISLVFGYIILTQYLFNFEKEKNDKQKKLENIEKIDNNIDEKEKKENDEIKISKEGIQKDKMKNNNSLENLKNYETELEGKEIDISEIPDFKE